MKSSANHTAECLSANRFGDGFDCLCDESPLAKAHAELDRATTRLDAALREIRELHGELTNTRAQLTAVMELDGDVFSAQARLGGCQQRVAELEAELAGCQTVDTGWPGR